jgi:hypothetical protein
MGRFRADVERRASESRALDCQLTSRGLWDCRLVPAVPSPAPEGGGVWRFEGEETAS